MVRWLSKLIKVLNRLIKGTAERGRRNSENQDIPIPLQLIDFEATLFIFQSLIRINNNIRRGRNIHLETI